MSNTRETIKGVIKALRENVELNAILDGRIYTKVPQCAKLPYIQVKISSRPWETSDIKGMVHDLDIMNYTEGETTETLSIHEAIYNAFHRQSIPITDHVDVNLEWKFGDPLGNGESGAFQTLDRYELTVIKVV